MKIVLAGAGAFGQKHLDAIRVIGGIEVDSLVGRDPAATREVATKIRHRPRHGLAGRSALPGPA